MFEIKSYNDEKMENELIVDGTKLTKDIGYFSADGREHLWVSIYDLILSKKVATISFNEVPKEIDKIELHYPIDFTNYINEVEFKREYRNSENIKLNFKISWDFEKWKKTYSIEEFAEEMKKKCN